METDRQNNEKLKSPPAGFPGITATITGFGALGLLLGRPVTANDGNPKAILLEMQASDDPNVRLYGYRMEIALNRVRKRFPSYADARLAHIIAAGCKDCDHVDGDGKCADCLGEWLYNELTREEPECSTK